MKQEFKKVITYTLLMLAFIAMCSFNVVLFANSNSKPVVSFGLSIGLSFILVGIISTLYFMIKLFLKYRHRETFQNVPRGILLGPITYLIANSALLIVSSGLIVYASVMIYFVV